MTDSPKKYKWFVLGDFNGFFGLMFDNLTVLSFLAGILIFGFKFPADIIYTRMFPGTAFGVLFGDIVYTWMAFRLAKRTGNKEVTAMPLGLDTPSTIGIALVVLGPAFIGMKAEGMSEHDAAMMTWYLGMATMVMIGIIKVIFSFFGGWIQKIVPQAGLLGSLAGIGLGLIGITPLLDIFGMPLVGLVALGLVLYALVAGIRLPWNIPGVFASVLVGTVLYYVLGHTGLVGGTFVGAPSPDLHLGFPIPTLLFLNGLGPALKYLPIAIPFGILTVVGGINVTESARVAGDDYKTRDILLTEALQHWSLAFAEASRSRPVHRPARLQTNGFPCRIHAPDRHLHWSWRNARICFIHRGSDPPGRAGAHPRLRGPRYYCAVLPCLSRSPCTGGSVCILPDNSAPALDQAEQP